ncbi:MAG: response regulator transcription factor [Butyrivibrio sp.]
MKNILICDDERDIVNALKIYLSNKDYNIYTAYNGREAVNSVRCNDIHLVIMDIMMPVMDGISAMTEIRRFSNIPIILLTAKGEDNDKISGLDAGADDYITKPFNPNEVTARVSSSLRRYFNLGNISSSVNSYRIGGIELDDLQRKVTVDGEPVVLTPKEYDILKLLMRNPGTVFSPLDIYSHVWNERIIGCESTVAVHIRHLREKIEIDPANPRTLKVVWGQGYKIESGDSVTI